MRRKFFIRHGDFGNVYDLAWADTLAHCSQLIGMGFTQCSRKYAERKARDERYRRHFDQYFSGYADNAVHPAVYYVEWPEEDCDTKLWKEYDLNGVIWE